MGNARPMLGTSALIKGKRSELLLALLLVCCMLPPLLWLQVGLNAHRRGKSDTRTIPTLHGFVHKAGPPARLFWRDNGDIFNEWLDLIEFRATGTFGWVIKAKTGLMAGMRALMLHFQGGQLRQSDGVRSGNGFVPVLHPPGAVSYPQCELRVVRLRYLHGA